MKSAQVSSERVYQQIAQLHVACIDQGFLSTLGEGFLVLLYKAIDRDPGSVLVICEKNGRVVGFVAGTLSLRTIYLRLLRRFLRLCWALIPVLISPSKMFKLIEVVVHGYKGKPLDDCPSAELLSIAVAADQRGTEVSRRLYEGLCGQFESQGISEFCIVVGDALVPAHRFYKKMGATQIGAIEIHAGHKSIVYRQRCNFFV